WVPWKADRKAYFQKLRDNAVKSVKGQLIKDVEYSVGDIKGREISIKMVSGTAAAREGPTKTVYRVERVRMFFIGKRLFLLMVVLPEEEIDLPFVNDYLNSFAYRYVT